MEGHRTWVNNQESTDLRASKLCNAGIKVNANPPISVSASGEDGKGSGEGKGRFQKPTLELVKLHGIKIELPATECEKFFDYYESNGWRVGKNPMKMWTAAMANWKRHWEDY